MSSKAKASSVVAAIIALSRAANIAGMAALALMTLLTVADVFLRYVFKQPILDSVQLIEYLMVCTSFLAFAWCAATGKHVTVDLVVSHFAPRVQAVFDSITYLLGLGACFIIAWRSLVEGLIAKQNEKASTLLGVPVYPFYLILTFGVAMLCLVMLTQLAQHLYKAAKG